MSVHLVTGRDPGSDEPLRHRALSTLTILAFPAPQLFLAAAKVSLPLGEKLLVAALGCGPLSQEVRVVVGGDGAGSLVLGETVARPPLAGTGTMALRAPDDEP